MVGSKGIVAGSVMMEGMVAAGGLAGLLKRCS
jgi:hypothetical protein